MTECVTPGGVRRIRESTEGPLSDVSVQVRRGPFPVAERLPGKRRCSKSIERTRRVDDACLARRDARRPLNSPRSDISTFLRFIPGAQPQD